MVTAAQNTPRMSPGNQRFFQNLLDAERLGHLFAEEIRLNPEKNPKPALKAYAASMRKASGFSLSNNSDRDLSVAIVNEFQFIFRSDRPIAYEFYSALQGIATDKFVHRDTQRHVCEMAMKSMEEQKQSLQLEHYHALRDNFDHHIQDLEGIPRRYDVARLRATKHGFTRFFEKQRECWVVIEPEEITAGAASTKAAKKAALASKQAQGLMKDAYTKLQRLTKPYEDAEAEKDAKSYVSIPPPDSVLTAAIETSLAIADFPLAKTQAIYKDPEKEIHAGLKHCQDKKVQAQVLRGIATGISTTTGRVSRALNKSAKSLNDTSQRATRFLNQAAESLDPTPSS